MKDTSSKKDAPSMPAQEITFNYIKSASFRSIHVDGAIGGITPSRNVHFSVYNERPAIPQQTVHKLTPEGRLADEVMDRRVARPGVVRELEADLIMDRSTAEGVRDWLTEQIEQLKALESGR